MIATHIYGGLGNQMFQLAHGLSLAARLQTELVIDTRYYDRKRPTGMALSLSHFDIKAPEITRHRLPAVMDDGLFAFLKAQISGTDWQFYREAGPAYDAATRTLPDSTYLRGYWQSERYFNDHADLVRDRLQLLTPPGDETLTVMKAQDACLPVSLHIRRGDYVSNVKFSSIFGTCDLDYYRRAADRIAANSATEPTFFAFSDDPDWVAENLKLPYETVLVRHNGPDQNYDDIRLMTRCRHHIIANSSFSWWGGWLNPDPDKIVIAPARWFADPSREIHDIVPESWLRL